MLQRLDQDEVAHASRITFVGQAKGGQAASFMSRNASQPDTRARLIICIVGLVCLDSGDQRKPGFEIAVLRLLTERCRSFLRQIVPGHAMGKILYFSDRLALIASLNPSCNLLHWDQAAVLSRTLVHHLWIDVRGL